MKPFSIVLKNVQDYFLEWSLFSAGPILTMVCFPGPGRPPQGWVFDLACWAICYLFARTVWRLPRVLWSYFDRRDLGRLAASLATTGALYLFTRFALRQPFPDLFPPVPAPYFLLAFLGSWSALLVWRLGQRQAMKHAEGLAHTQGRILVLGAGEAGRDILEDLRQKGHLRDVVGILDDDPSKGGRTLMGVPILGPIDLVASVVADKGVEDVILAVQHLPEGRLTRIVDALDLKKTRIRIIPSSGETFMDRMTVDRTREIRAEDLLGRKAADLDVDLIKESFRGKVVLITGAGGSIGSEICHQLLSFPLSRMVCLSRSEYSLYRLQEKLSPENLFQIPIIYALGDVRDEERMNELFAGHRPQVVFHAAAHKHVPYMENHEKEAFKNNVVGSATVVKAAHHSGVEKFILVSTDKAVRPTNVMGASKRLAEMYVTGYGKAHGISTALVRFGNVLGSRGSVVPLFRRQILKGGPITVTHPDVVRFFMTVPEAAQLVISAGSLSKGGERFVLDMGAPVRIDDLVRRMIRLYRYEPDRDIAITYTGLRPGEKLYEELLTATEAVSTTGHRKIFTLVDEKGTPSDYLDWVDRADTWLPNTDAVSMRRAMMEWVPDFTPLGPDGKPWKAPF